MCEVKLSVINEWTNNLKVNKLYICGVIRIRQFRYTTSYASQKKSVQSAHVWYIVVHVQKHFDQQF